MPLNLPPPKVTLLNGQSASPSSAAGLAAPSPQFQGSSTSNGYTPAPPASSSTGLNLPPPKTKAKTASSGPKKFVLDLPKPVRTAGEAGLSSSVDEGPSAKRARTDGSSHGLSGLNGLLPEPSRPSAGTGGLKLPEPKSQSIAYATAGSKENGQKATSLLPHVLKGKGKAAEKKEAVPEVQEQPKAQAEPELDFFGLAASPSPNEPAADFFGLGGASTSAAPAPIPTSKSAFSAAPSAVPVSSPKTSSIKISAAPSTSAPSLSSNYYATLPLPSPKDPYPGFYQKSDMSWAAKRPEEWEIWAKAQGWAAEAEQTEEPQAKKKEKEYEMPSDFDEAALGNSVEIRAAALRGANGGIDTRPSKVPEEDRLKAEQEKMNAKANEKKFSHAARSRHQLSTLIAAAKDNRAELEDRISQMKANKRTGGSKYGF